MSFVLIENLHDVTVGQGVENFEDVRTSRQNVCTNAWNLDSPTESNDSFPVPLVSHC
jgi:hypothetical protein